MKGGSYLGTVVYATPEVGGLLLVAIFGATVSKGRARIVIGYGLLYATLYALYLLKVGGDFMEYRFMWTVYPVVLLAGLRGLVSIANKSRATGISLAVVLVGLSLMNRISATDSFGFPDIIRDKYTILGHEVINLMVEEGTLAGRTMKRVLPMNTTISTTLAGTIPYYSELHSIDQWGLNEPYVKNTPAPPRISKRSRQARNRIVPS